MLISGNSYASYLGYQNITINDGYGEKGFDGGPTGQGLEDQEVEPGCLANQDWDVEGFYHSGSNLAMVGGWNFLSGDPAYPAIQSGDIFFNTDSDSFYEYVMDMDFSSGTYDIYALSGLDNDGITLTSGGPAGLTGLIWNFTDTTEGSILASNLSYSYTTGLSDGAVDLLGGSHNALGVDISFLAPGTEFTSYFTMQCGNDILMGTSTAAPVPEPATMFLLGSGIIGFAGLRKRSRKI